MSSLESRERPVTEQLTLLPFGPLSEVISTTATVTVGLPITGAALREAVLDAYPELRERTFRLAVDKRIPGDEAIITEAREIALLPPFAGG